MVKLTKEQKADLKAVIKEAAKKAEAMKGEFTKNLIEAVKEEMEKDK